jgi:hypothetical protein
MAKPTKQTTLDPRAHMHLDVLRVALGSQGLGREVDKTDIVSALVLYTPPPQLAGMLLEYWRYYEARLKAQAAGKPDPEPGHWTPGTH